LSPNKNSLEFGNLMLRIYDCCDAYSGDREPLQDEYEICEIEFTNFMEKIYFQLKKFIKRAEKYKQHKNKFYRNNPDIDRDEL
jgi:hypothetical protein